MKKAARQRARANLAQLEFIARKLGEINQEVVYVGGCATALLISDDLAPDVRPTTDVDCIVDITTKVDYYQLSNRLRERGFQEDMNSKVMCRWLYGNAVLDVMPTNSTVLTFGNRWYEQAFAHTQCHQLADNLVVNSVTAPYFIATKIEAFHGRGNRDFHASHDFEDIVAILDGRQEIVAEISNESEELKKYFHAFFSAILNDDDFLTSLPGHVADGAVTQQRVAMVLERIKKITLIE